jgi:hypothetical protein
MAIPILHDPKQIRKRVWYERWMRYLRDLREKDVPEDFIPEIGRYTHRMLNEVSAYGSISKADYAQESLEMAIVDLKEEC